MKSAVLAFALSLSLYPCLALPSPLIVPRQSFVLCASRNSGTISVALNKELMNTNCGWWQAYIFPDMYHVYRTRALFFRVRFHFLSRIINVWLSYRKNDNQERITLILKN